MSAPAAAPLALSRAWTVEDLYALPEDGLRHELLDGVLLVSPAPVPRHQLVTGRLRQLLVEVAPADLEVVEAINVRVPAGLTVPDVVVAEADVFESGARDVQPGQVRLVVEVASPSSRRVDRSWKREVYAEAGIPSHWRVELDVPSGPRVVVAELVGGSYVDRVAAAADTVLELERPVPVAFRPGDLVAPRSG